MADRVSFQHNIGIQHGFFNLAHLRPDGFAGMQSKVGSIDGAVSGGGRGRVNKSLVRAALKEQQGVWVCGWVGGSSMSLPPMARVRALGFYGASCCDARGGGSS